MNEAFTKITSKTEANDMTDAMLEKTVGEIVSVFQHYASYLHKISLVKKQELMIFKSSKKDQICSIMVQGMDIAPLLMKKSLSI